MFSFISLECLSLIVKRKDGTIEYISNGIILLFLFDLETIEGNVSHSGSISTLCLGCFSEHNIVIAEVSRVFLIYFDFSCFNSLQL